MIMRLRGVPSIEPPKHRADAREQLAQIERLYQIVISAKFEANDSINVVTPMTGNNDDRHIGTRPDVSQQIKTLLLSEVKIEDDKVHGRAAELTDHVVAAGRHPVRMLFSTK